MNRYMALFFFAFIFFFSCKDGIVTQAPTVFDGSNGATVLATYSSIRDNVLQPSCGVSGCHGGSYFPNLSGNSYNNIVNVTSSAGIPYIKPGNASDSYLLRKLKGENIYGAKMPYGLPALSQGIIDSIETWINNGAQNN